MHDQIEHKGRVVAITQSKITVQIIAESACASCHSKGMCSLSDMKEKLIEINNANTMSFNIGDGVIVFMRQNLGYLALFLGYLFPFILLIISLFVFNYIFSNQVKAGISSIILLIPYYFILYLFRKKLSKKFEFGLK